MSKEIIRELADEFDHVTDKESAIETLQTRVERFDEMSDRDDDTWGRKRDKAKRQLETLGGSVDDTGEVEALSDANGLEEKRDRLQKRVDGFERFGWDKHKERAKAELETVERQLASGSDSAANMDSLERDPVLDTYADSPPGAVWVGTPPALDL